MQTVIDEFTRKLDEMEQFAVAAEQWASLPLTAGTTKFSLQHKEIIVESAFLRAFHAWEVFLEESFVSYLLGNTPPKGSPPKCKISVTRREVALQVLNSEGAPFIPWTVPAKVVTRAENFFDNGLPYAPIINNQSSRLTEASTVRNAVAHAQSSAQDKFLKIVRRELTTIPTSGITVGRFLATRVPRSKPPESFFTQYLNRFRYVADQIVPH